MGFFQLPFGIRIAGGEPVDGDRYVMATITGRNLLLTQNRTFEGLLVYVLADQTLYILKGPANTDWEALAGGGDLSWEFVQNTPLISWSLPHNMGKQPSVTIKNDSGDEVEAFVNHTDDNNLTITFNVAFQGVATLN